MMCIGRQYCIHSMKHGGRGIPNQRKKKEKELRLIWSTFLIDKNQRLGNPPFCRARIANLTRMGLPKFYLWPVWKVVSPLFMKRRWVFWIFISQTTSLLHNCNLCGRTYLPSVLFICLVECFAVKCVNQTHFERKCPFHTNWELQYLR